MLIRCVLLLCFAAATGATQEVSPRSATPSWAPGPGAHIRGYVLRPDSTAIEGWIVRYDDTVAAISTCTPCAVSLYVPIDSVLALEEGHERSKYSGGALVTHVLKSTGIGAGIGAGISLAAVATGDCKNDGCELAPLVVGAATILGGGVGLVVGVITSVGPPEQVWTPVRRED